MRNQMYDRRFRRDPRTTPMPGRSREFFSGGFGRAIRCRHGGGLEPRPGIVAETPRLILRRFEAEDFPAYLEMNADPVMSRYSGRAPSGPEEAWTRLLRHAGHWSLTGYGFVAIEEKATGRLAGEAGLGDFKRRLGPDFDDSPEAGWAVAPWAQGRGYATEAAAAALQWIEARRGVERTVCLIHVENLASIRVAEKLGYTPFGACTYRGYEGLTFERRRS
jgi:RimJ/RimL family protein N-acetyltransferase